MYDTFVCRVHSPFPSTYSGSLFTVQPSKPSSTSSPIDSNAWNYSILWNAHAFYKTQLHAHIHTHKPHTSKQSIFYYIFVCFTFYRMHNAHLLHRKQIKTNSRREILAYGKMVFTGLISGVHITH